MFQTARELFQQRMEEEEDEEEGERGKREWRKPKSRSGQMYHVNANGEFSDSGGEEEEEEVSIAEQIRRKIGLGSKVAVEKGKPGVKGSKMVQSGSKSMLGESKSMQNTQKSMQSTLNFKQHTSKPPSSLLSTSIPSSSLPPSKSRAIPLPTSTSPPHPQPKSQSKPKSKPSPEKKTKPVSSSSLDTKNTPQSSTSFASSSHTHSSLTEPPSSAPSRKRPSPSTRETSPQSPLDLSKAPDRSMSLPIPHLTHRPKKLLLAISEDVQKLTACLDVSAKQRIKCVEASSRCSSLTPSLQKKYRVALTPYLPSDWVDCIAWQQARLQEHQLIAENRQNERAQADIRSFFGKHGSADQSEKQGKLLSRYKAGYAKIFGEVAQCGKDGRLPPFVPVNAEINAVNTENLMLTTKCRWSLLPFCSPEALTPILKHVVMLIARQTPKDEGKEEFAKRVHSQVDKSIKLKQPFLLKSDSRLCFKHVLYIVE